MKNLSSLFGKDNLDEIVFANRNKAYGAYSLRTQYSGDLTKALFAGVAFFASLSIVPLIVSAFSTETIIDKTFTVDDPRILVTVDVPDTPKPQPTATIPPDIKTVASPIFKPVREVKKETPVPTKKDFEGAAIGSETKDGKETTITSVPPTIIAGPPTIAPTAPPAKPIDPNEIFSTTNVDVAADFKGGINAFRQKVANAFDTESVEKTGMVSGVITFVVEKDGSISDLKVTGSSADFNAEAERTVKSIKTKWTPAQLKGKPVRSSFRMPISMKIE